MTLEELKGRRPRRGQASTDFDLRERLKRLGIKQVHFADYIGRDHSGLRRWIRNEPPPPGEIEMLVDILDHHILGRPLPGWLETVKNKANPAEVEE